jgi:integrase
MTKHSKTTAEYWLSRVYFHKQAAGPETDYSVFVQFDGRRERFPLGTANKRRAAELAREIYRTLKAGGWDLAIAVYKKGQSIDGDVTIGQYLAAVRRVWTQNEATLHGYERAIRMIASELFDLDPDNLRFNYAQAGSAAWRARTDEVCLSDITTEKLNTWALGYAGRDNKTRGPKAEPETNQVNLNRRRISANSYLRNAKALFSPKLLKRTGFKLASVPFAGVEFMGGTDSRYFSNFNIREVLSAARAELATFDPDMLSVILLSAIAGLRKSEIDLLEWPSIDFDHGFIQLRLTEYYQAKTSDSLRAVPFNAPWVLEWFQAQKAAQGRQARFVVAPGARYQPDQKINYYRASDLFGRVSAWLRKHGVKAIRPLHTLRKEAGADIVRRSGLVAGAAFLRHSNVSTTAQHYTDWRITETPSFVDVGTEEKNIVKFENSGLTA